MNHYPQVSVQFHRLTKKTQKDIPGPEKEKKEERKIHKRTKNELRAIFSSACEKLRSILSRARPKIERNVTCEKKIIIMLIFITLQKLSAVYNHNVDLMCS